MNPLPRARASSPVAVSLFALLSGCDPPHGEPFALFESRAPIAPYLEKLRSSGGDPSKVLHPTSVKDLASLASGKGYKFAVLADGRLAIAPLPVDAPVNEYVHPVLAGGLPVRTAGQIRIERSGESLARVVLNQNSRAYCPSADSLRAAVLSLVSLGVPQETLRLENQPPECAQASPPPPVPAAAAPTPRYGALMVEIGHRFELIGRAAKAKRFELAAFELHEMEEAFEDLARANPPKASRDVPLGGMAEAFMTTHPEALRSALAKGDMAASRDAFQAAATSCNACHQASRHGFVEIPGEMGASVPRLDVQR